MLFEDDDVLSDDSSAWKRGKRLLKDFLLNSAVGRTIVEAGRLSFIAFFLYMAFSWCAEIFLFLLKILKMAIATSVAP